MVEPEDGIGWFDAFAAVLWSVETFAALTGLACVVLTVRRSVANWPVGIASSLAYILVFYEVRLYADAALQVMFIALSIVGWRRWLAGDPRLGASAALSVTRTGLGEAVVVGVGMIGAAVAWGALLAAYTDAAVPWIDAGNAAVSVAAQWLMTRKKLESWLLWLATDICQVGVYIDRNLLPTAGLYAIFSCLAVLGLVEWSRELARDPR